MHTAQLELSGDELAPAEQPAQQGGMTPGERTPEAKRPFKSAAGLEAFRRCCDARQAPNPDAEPDWDDHLKAIGASRRKGLPSV